MSGRMVGHVRYRAKKKMPHANAAPPYQGTGEAARHHQDWPRAAINRRTSAMTTMKGILFMGISTAVT